MIIHYDSIESFAQAVNNNRDVRGSRYWLRGDRGRAENSRLYGGNGFDSEEALELAIKGDPSMVGQATNAIEKISQYGLGDGLACANVFSPAGSRVSVPRFLGGNPMSMVRRERQVKTTRHVNIYVGIAASAGVGISNMLKRGATILGLLETLQMLQIGVTVYLLEESGHRSGDFLYQLIRIESQPLDLSTCGFAIAHPAFVQNVLYPMVDALSGGNGVQWPDDYSSTARYTSKLRERLNAGPSDLFIPSAYLDQRIVEAPEAWIVDMIRQVTDNNTIEE